MINFFRKIRRQLANENKFSRYFRYAFGEVVLIMLGIFMALQLQNWNEQRKQDAQFKVTLEQVYNSITDDSWYFNFNMMQSQNVLDTLKYLLNTGQNDSGEQILGALWYSALNNIGRYNTETIQILDNLEYNIRNKNQNNLAKQLYSYGKLLTEKNQNPFESDKSIADILTQNNIPFPKLDLNDLNKGLISDSTYYGEKEFKKAKALLQDENLITRLKSERTYRAINFLDYKAIYTDALSMLQLIKKYHPEAKLLYQDVGIIGTSIDGFDDVGAKSTPMTLTDDERSIWEIDLYLKVGRVKFRCRDSWAINWGGNSFPEGQAQFEGPDISVSEPGNYRVVLNLTANTYEFIKLEDQP
jgi:hypothetical protein